jgi:flagellar protein FliS
MLYEGAIRFLQQAVEAIEQGDANGRYKKLTRAGEIIIALQSAIDLVNGGPQAHALYDFYASLDGRILALHRSNDTEAGKQMIAEIREIRDVWDHIDRAAPQS